IIWDEVGEDQFEREKVLLDLEQECLEVYRRKVDSANISRARLHQELAESEAEFTHLLLSLGERSLPGRRSMDVGHSLVSLILARWLFLNILSLTARENDGTLKEQLDSITPALREMQLRKEERVYMLVKSGKNLLIIWDEVGEDQFEREKVLLDLEQECLEVYRRKVDSANISRARLHQELAESEAEFTHLLLSLGERSLPGRRSMDVGHSLVSLILARWLFLNILSLTARENDGTLKEQLDSITPALREMQLRKEERKKLEEYQTELQRLHKEKTPKIGKIYEHSPESDCYIGNGFVNDHHKSSPSLNELSGLSKNISDSILAKLNSTGESLEEEKRMRLEKLHHLGKVLTNLWNLMNTPYEDRQLFSHITGLLSVSSAEISTPGILTLDIIQQAEAEVKRLDQLKASKMKELFLKKQFELEEICHGSHMEIPSRSEMDNIINLINSGEIDYAHLLMSMDDQISKAKDEASSRKVIMEKVEKWMSACEEERWLEEYSRDENRYSVSRGAHKNLRRAERARIMVNKIPALVDSLIAKTKDWEGERNKTFLLTSVEQSEAADYFSKFTTDQKHQTKVPLLAMMEEYNMLRNEKEKEKQRQRVIHTRPDYDENSGNTRNIPYYNSVVMSVQ
ncbi:hypothetical protein C3L33_13860, partial [Rhododendron williamsianum]